MQINVIKLENQKEYAIIKELIIDNITYVYLNNINDNKDFTIRKKDHQDLIGLDNLEELEKVMAYFTIKRND